jgi:hypothetical protein
MALGVRGESAIADIALRYLRPVDKHGKTMVAVTHDLAWRPVWTGGSN